jgi:hypothetical protein
MAHNSNEEHESILRDTTYKQVSLNITILFLRDYIYIIFGRTAEWKVSERQNVECPISKCMYIHRADNDSKQHMVDVIKCRSNILLILIKCRHDYIDVEFYFIVIVPDLSYT